MGKMEKLEINLDSLVGNPANKNANEFKALWKETVKQDESEHSTVVSFKDGKLTVCVDNSIYLQDFILRRMDILRRLNEVSDGKKVDEICFKFGGIA